MGNGSLAILKISMGLHLADRSFYLQGKLFRRLRLNGRGKDIVSTGFLAMLENDSNQRHREDLMELKNRVASIAERTRSRRQGPHPLNDPSLSRKKAETIIAWVIVYVCLLGFVLLMAISENSNLISGSVR